jgi:hypothetical protein
MAYTLNRLAKELIEDIFASNDAKTALEHAQRKLHKLVAKGKLNVLNEICVEEDEEMGEEEAIEIIESWLEGFAKNPVELQERWFVFLPKLEVKMKEFCQREAIPKLIAIKDDEDKARLYFNGAHGQLNNMRKRAWDIYETEIIGTYYLFEHYLDFGGALYDKLYEFRTLCYNRHKEFEQNFHDWSNKLTNTLDGRDYE